jgi:membrane-bound ClpP family serine protease
MWLIAGVLLGVVVVASLAGFHAGPHAHAVAAIAGVLAAVVLVIMAATGHDQPLLFVLLGADVSLSTAVGYGAWRALVSAPGATGAGHGDHPLHGGRWGIEASMGTALSTLDPKGIVRVRGEEWSAESVNGTIPAGTAVQVIEVDGLRLRVWGEEAIEAIEAINDGSIGAVADATLGSTPVAAPSPVQHGQRGQEAEAEVPPT